jgi:hypothetical protein
VPRQPRAIRPYPWPITPAIRILEGLDPGKPKVWASERISRQSLLAHSMPPSSPTQTRPQLPELPKLWFWFCPERETRPWLWPPRLTVPFLSRRQTLFLGDCHTCRIKGRHACLKPGSKGRGDGIQLFARRFLQRSAWSEDHLNRASALGGPAWGKLPVTDKPTHHRTTCDRPLSS